MTTLHFPCGHPLQHRPKQLRGTDNLVPFSDVPDGALFRLLSDDCVYERLGKGTMAAKLVPWDDSDYWDVGHTDLCELLEEVRPHGQ